MKTLKKALSIILGLAIMLSCVAGMQVSVAAEGTVALSVGEATVADGVVTVPVVVDANAGFQSLAVTVSYDDAVLDLVSAEKNAKFGAADDVAAFGPYDANPFKMMWAYAYSTENVTATGTIATLTFNLVDETAETADITLAVTEAWDVAGNEVAATTAEKETVDLVTGPVLDTTMVFRTPALVTIGETLGLRLRARASVLNDATATYKFVVTTKKYDGTTLNEVVNEPVECDIVKSGSNYQYEISNIAITELGLDVEAYIVRYNAKGELEAYSDVYTVSPAEILKGMIVDTAAEGTSAYKLNTMIADLLNLGATAQDYFPGLTKNTTCDLYTSARVNEGVDQKWASVDLADLNPVDTDTNTIWNPDSAVTATTNALAMEVGLNPAPAPTFVVRNATATGNNPLDYSKLTLNISYTSENDGKTRTKTVTGSDWEALVSRKHLKCPFPSVAMYDSNQVITAVLTYDGTEVFTTTYTIETFIDAYASDAAMGTIVTNVGKFGASARNYFNSLG